MNGLSHIGIESAPQFDPLLRLCLESTCAKLWYKGQFSSIVLFSLLLTSDPQRLSSVKLLDTCHCYLHRLLCPYNAIIAATFEGSIANLYTMKSWPMTSPLLTECIKAAQSPGAANLTYGTL